MLFRIKLKRIISIKVFSLLFMSQAPSYFICNSGLELLSNIDKRFEYTMF